jgi:hypothetical protein
MIRKWSLVPLLAAAILGGCANPHYNLDVRNNTGEIVALNLVARDKGKEEPRVQKARVSPGHTVSMFTDGKKGEKVTLEARIDGQPESPPAVLPITSGLSSIDIYDAPRGQTPPLKLREVVRPG